MNAHLHRMMNTYARASLSARACKFTDVARGWRQQKCRRFSRSVTRNSVKMRDDKTVRYLTLANARKGNILSLEAIQQLQAHIECVPEAVRCVVLSAEGAVFSAGHDLRQLTSQCGSQQHREVFEQCTRLMLSIQRSPVTVIAQVDGVAAAAGLQLVLSCDIVLATRDSQFSTPGSNVGLFCSTPGVALARAAPRLVAAQMLLTGQPISGERALWAGLVSELVQREQMQDRTSEIVEAIAAKSRSVQALGKQFFYQQLRQSDLQEAYKQACHVMTENIALQDAQEGISAFINKRPALWTNSMRTAKSDSEQQ